jgi:hypothetical protein
MKAETLPFSLIAAITLLGSFSGCAATVSPYALASAGRIGCPAEYIALSDIEDGDGAPQAWVAGCFRKHYACSSNGDPRRPNTRIICSELGQPRAWSVAR